MKKCALALHLMDERGPMKARLSPLLVRLASESHVYGGFTSGQRLCVGGAQAPELFAAPHHEEEEEEQQAHQRQVHHTAQHQQPAAGRERTSTSGSELSHPRSALSAVIDIIRFCRPSSQLSEWGGYLLSLRLAAGTDARSSLKMYLRTPRK